MLIKVLGTENYVLGNIFTPMCISLRGVNNCNGTEMPDAQ